MEFQNFVLPLFFFVLSNIPKIKGKELAERYVSATTVIVLRQTTDSFMEFN